MQGKADNADGIASFIARWQKSSAAERANFQPFLTELCDALQLAAPDPTTNYHNTDAYVFERAVTFNHPDGTTTTGRIDLYKRGCFVLEAKQAADPDPVEQFDLILTSQRKPAKRGKTIRGTSRWNDSMIRARGQVERYAKALPASEGWPPFLVIVDVGYCIELYADFSRTGKHYAQFPDAAGFRIELPKLALPEIQDRLRTLWDDPLALDPSRHAAKVTREIAAHLAELAKSLESAGHAPKTVATFLMRCLFTMFAEDVGLLNSDLAFTELLRSLRGQPEKFQPLATELWRKMDTGGFSTALRADLRRFNGGLFAPHASETEALPLDGVQLGLLIAAAARDWSLVEPAIFGTLLERALDEGERGRLGAHYTPRAYVERLVLPTIMEPLRTEWESVKAAAIKRANETDLAGALKEVRDFHHRLCNLRVLDPACGSGNFLYVSMEHMKRLEGEVLDLLVSLGQKEFRLELRGETVDPHQFLGIEKNPRAQVVAELVLWIGYLQWHFRTRGRTPPAEPVLRNFHNIELRDALLEFDRAEMARDERGRPVTRWDGHSTKLNPLTGEDVPDETKRVEVYRYVRPRRAVWPDADFIIGNPPFIAGKDLRAELGEGYAEALWSTYPEVPQSADIVMYWWHRAAQAVAAAKTQRFGLISTSSMHQVFSRRVVEQALNGKSPLSIAFAIPDHPWVDGEGNAAVRIAMTVGAKGKLMGRLLKSIAEKPTATGEADVTLAETLGKILANLRVGADVAGARPLRANEGLCCPGVKLHGSGFIVTLEQAKSLGLGKIRGLERHIRPYLNGRDLTGRSRNVMVIDLFGLTERQVQERFPAVFQWIAERVKPERDQNNRASYRDYWWIFGEPRRELRPALDGLSRYIATVETAKHRVFVFLDASILPDNKLIAIASDDAFCLGVLSSVIHVLWALATGGWLGYGNDPVYVKSKCFDPFPFPVCNAALRRRITDLAERIDSHRKRQQSKHPALTITDMYNVLVKARAGETLSPEENVIHLAGTIGILAALHDDLDRAVFDAYGWPRDLSEEEILDRVVRLNRERYDEEENGLVRWLRPDYQETAPIHKVAKQKALALEEVAAAGKVVWPKDLPRQFTVIRAALSASPSPVTPQSLAKKFTGANSARVGELLDTLAALGHAQKLDEGRYSP